MQQMLPHRPPSMLLRPQHSRSPTSARAACAHQKAAAPRVACAAAAAAAPCATAASPAAASTGGRTRRSAAACRLLPRLAMQAVCRLDAHAFCSFIQKQPEFNMLW